MREATIPTTPGCQPSPAITTAGASRTSSGSSPQRALGAGERLALGEAPLAVGAVQLLRDLGGAVGVGGQHQLDPGVGAVEAPRGVDPRRQAEAEVALVDALDLAARSGDQRPQADPLPAAGLGDALPDERAVLAAKGHEVGDRGEGDEVEVGEVGRVDIGPLAKGRGELVGDRRRAELLERIAGDPRVQDRAVRQALAGLVVVGDDHFDAELAGKGDLVGAADAAVGGQQQACSRGGEAADGVRGEPVAVGEPVRYEPVALGAGVAQGRDQDRGRADPVDVVVAVDRDLEAGARGGEEALNDLFHRVELEGVVGLRGG